LRSYAALSNSSGRRRAVTPVPVRTGALATLLIIPILLPQFLAQLRIGLVHRRLAQLAGDDVVVAAIRDAGWNGVRPAATAGAAAHTTATAPLATAAFALTLALALTLSGTLAATLLAAGALSFSAGTPFAFAARIAALAFALAFALALALSATAASATALAGDRLLLGAHAAVENAERLIEFEIDLRGAFAGRHRTAAAAGAATLRAALSTLTGAAGRTRETAGIAASGSTTRGATSSSSATH